MSRPEEKETSTATPKAEEQPPKALTNVEDLPDEPEMLAAFRKELERAQAKIADLESQQEAAGKGPQTKKIRDLNSRLQEVTRKARDCKSEIERLQSALQEKSAELQGTQQQLKDLKKANALLKQQFATETRQPVKSDSSKAPEKTAPEADRERESPLAAEINIPASPNVSGRIARQKISGSQSPATLLHARLKVISGETRQPATILYHHQSFQLQVSFTNGTKDLGAWEGFQYESTVFARSLAGKSQEIFSQAKRAIQGENRIFINIKANTLTAGDYRLQALITIFAPDGNTISLTAESSLIHIL